MRTIRLLLLTLLILAIPAASLAQFGVAITIAPPTLPIYAQPMAPADGYLWTPGYWAYGEEGYFWVPGKWVMAPEVGFLWTPGYWGWGGNAYAWNVGYWGTNVGFYGGVNYGFGYGGVGYQGGYWRNGGFYYNRSVNNVNVTNIHEHRFRVNQADYSNHRFQYGGYWFGFEGAWPSNWLCSQDVYVVEIDGVYYLCNSKYPGVNIMLSVIL